MKLKTNRKNTFQGSVLFTVLSVLAVVLVLMIATIGFASAASKRAYKEYHDAQINSTGRSVINSVLTSLNPNTGGNQDLGAQIFSATLAKKGDSYEVFVSDGGNLGNGLGTVEKIEFAYAGLDTDKDDEAAKLGNGKKFFIKGSGNPIIKVTATIKMGNETTTYSEYVSDMVTTPGGGGDGGLIGTNSVKSTGTGMNVFGPVGGGLNYGKKLDKIDDSDKDYLNIGNDGIIRGVAFFNSNIEMNAHRVFLFDENKPVSSYGSKSSSDYNGLFVLGGISFQNNSSFLSSYDKGNDKSTPYIFATGELYFPNGLQIGSPTTYPVENSGKLGNGTNPVYIEFDDMVERAGNKINVYCGSIKTNMGDVKFVRATSDIYCYDDGAESQINGLASSPLVNWVDAIAKKDKNKMDEANRIDGCFKTKGSLALGAPTKNSQLQVNGDVFVEKKLTIGCPGVTITGDVSAHVLKTSKNYTDAESIIADFNCKALEFDYLIDASGNKYDKDFTSVTLTEEQMLATPMGLTADKGFGESKELENLLGIKFDTDTTDGSEQLSKIDKQEYTLATGSLPYKTVQVPTEMNNRYYVEDNGKMVLKGSKSKSAALSNPVIKSNNGIPYIERDIVTDGDYYYAPTTEAKYMESVKMPDPSNPYWIETKKITVDAAKNIEIDAVKRTGNVGSFKYYEYAGKISDLESLETNAAGELIIRKSCVLSGTFKNQNIRVIPGEGTEPLWIELDNFNSDSDNSIIVEDIIKDGNSFYDSEGKVTKAAPVYFYIKDGTDLTLGGYNILTEYYASEYFDKHILKKTFEVPTANVPEEMKPGIYIFGSNDEDAVKTSGKFLPKEKITLSGGSVVTAYIVAPRAALHATNAGYSSEKGVNSCPVMYKGNVYTGLAVGIVGSAIVGDISEAQNNICLVYINNSDGEETDGTEQFGFTPIPGYSSY